MGMTRTTFDQVLIERMIVGGGSLESIYKSYCYGENGAAFSLDWVLIICPKANGAPSIRRKTP
jgi:hypothetical protein